MHSLKDNYRAVIAGSTGGIGSAFVEILKQDKNCSEVIGLSRSTSPHIDFSDETTIADAAAEIGGEVHLFIDATGFLSDEVTQPERSLKVLDADNMSRLFEANALGPVLLMKHFTPKLPRYERAIFTTLSARVGSIGDNKLGGWYTYRASKAALNMFVKCTSIEVRRNRSEAVIVALRPGTVETKLSDPFAGSRERLTAQQSANMMLDVLDGLRPEDTGTFWDYVGKRVEW